MAGEVFIARQDTLENVKQDTSDILSTLDKKSNNIVRDYIAGEDINIGKIVSIPNSFNKVCVNDNNMVINHARENGVKANIYVIPLTSEKLLYYLKEDKKIIFYTVQKYGDKLVKDNNELILNISNNEYDFRYVTVKKLNDNNILFIMTMKKDYDYKIVSRIVSVENEQIKLNSEVVVINNTKSYSFNIEEVKGGYLIVVESSMRLITIVNNSINLGSITTHQLDKDKIKITKINDTKLIIYNEGYMSIVDIHNNTIYLGAKIKIKLSSTNRVVFNITKVNENIFLLCFGTYDSNSVEVSVLRIDDNSNISLDTNSRMIASRYEYFWETTRLSDDTFIYTTYTVGNQNTKCYTVYVNSNFEISLAENEVGFGTEGIDCIRKINNSLLLLWNSSKTFILRVNSNNDIEKSQLTNINNIENLIILDDEYCLIISSGYKQGYVQSTAQSITDLINNKENTVNNGIPYGVSLNTAKKGEVVSVGIEGLISTENDCIPKGKFLKVNNGNLDVTNTSVGSFAIKMNNNEFYIKSIFER